MSTLVIKATGEEPNEREVAVLSLLRMALGALEQSEGIPTVLKDGKVTLLSTVVEETLDEHYEVRP